MTWEAQSRISFTSTISSSSSFTSAAAAAAKSLQSCPTLCDPIDGSPWGSPIPGILQARTLEWVAISFSNALKWKVKVKSLSRVWLLVTPWTVAHQAPPSMGFSRQACWSGVPLPSPCLRCRVRLFIWLFSCFLGYACIAMNFPLSTAFTVSHRFWVVVFSFSFVSMHILISSVICYPAACCSASICCNF